MNKFITYVDFPIYLKNRRAGTLRIEDKLNEEEFELFKMQVEFSVGVVRDAIVVPAVAPAPYKPLKVEGDRE